MTLQVLRNEDAVFIVKDNATVYPFEGATSTDTQWAINRILAGDDYFTSQPIGFMEMATQREHHREAHFSNGTSTRLRNTNQPKLMPFYIIQIKVIYA